MFFKDKVQVRDAVKVVTGTPFVPSSRPGPCAVKKAFQPLLDRIPGHHLQWNAVTKWQRSAKSSNSSSSTWAPEKEMLMEGIAYINENAPESDANNEQYGWILLNTKEDSESRIAGWPEFASCHLSFVRVLWRHGPQMAWRRQGSSSHRHDRGHGPLPHSSTPRSRC